MRVKIFGGNNSDELQYAINKWLEEHPTVHVLFVTQSSVSGAETIRDHCLISIWYEELNDFKRIEQDLNKEALKL